MIKDKVLIKIRITNRRSCQKCLAIHNEQGLLCLIELLYVRQSAASLDSILSIMDVADIDQQTRMCLNTDNPLLKEVWETRTLVKMLLNSGAMMRRKFVSSVGIISDFSPKISNSSKDSF